MTRSQSSNSLRFSVPRILNFLFVALLVGALFALNATSNKAQDAPQNPEPAATQPTEPQPTETPLPPSPATETVATEAPTAETPTTGTPAVEPATTAPEPQEPTSEGTTPGPVDSPTAGESIFTVTDGPATGSIDDPDGTLAAEKAAAEKKLEDAKKTEPPKTFGERVELAWKNYLDSAYFTWTIFLIIALGCFWLGNVLAKFWRLPEHNVRIFVLLLAFFGSIAAVGMGWHRLTLGIDLQGGVVLVYDVKPNATQVQEDGKVAPITSKTMENLVSAINRRINPGGVREISITPLGLRQVQVIIPKAEDAEVERIQRVISESGALTFRIMASTKYTQDESIIARARNEEGRDIRDASGKLLARWVPVMKGEESQFEGSSEFVSRPTRGVLEMLVLYNDGIEVTGDRLSSVREGSGERGEPGVSFTFDSVGEVKFRRLTRANQPDPAQPDTMLRHLGIILNDSLYSAPALKAVIGKSGIITFAPRTTDEGRKQLKEDIRHLIDVLSAGALPADLDDQPASKQQIGATLGYETIRQGSISLIASAVAVLLFMLVYYRLAGLIACFCVITNISLLIAIMLAIRAAFTLPGLAGIVLTIGMAVDANILIYERLREELRAGASLKMAIRNAYAKALSAIVDSNITTILTGVILYTVGTEQVKGFAVTLVLGVALSMFTAIYCARTIMDIFEAQRWIKTFKMMQLFKRPNINFLGMKKACAAFSIAISLVAIAAVFVRGKTILDIDFVGGVSVELVFNEPQETRFVRNTLNETDQKIKDSGKDETHRLNDLSVQEVQTESTGGNANMAGKFKHFIMTTSVPQVPGQTVSQDDYLVTVRGIVKEAFGDTLEYCRFDYTMGDSAKVGERTETTITLDVYPKMNYESIHSALTATITRAIKDGLLENDFDFRLTRENFAPGNQEAYSDWTLTAVTTPEIAESILSPMKAEQDALPYFPTSTTVGGSVASDTRTKGLLAILGSLICIVLYIWFRFSKIVYGVVAAIGLIHDVIVVLGMIALSAWLASPLGFLQISEFKIGLTVVAAFLTIIGYSLNDTIILFDRIRENKGKSPILTDTMINASINQTLSRTVLTSLTTFLVAIILYVWGGPGIHTFAFAMSVGVAFGTYSTIGVCAPLLYWMTGVEDTSKKKEDSFKISEK